MSVILCVQSYSCQFSMYELSEIRFGWYVDLFIDFLFHLVERELGHLHFTPIYRIVYVEQLFMYVAVCISGQASVSSPRAAVPAAHGINSPINYRYLCLHISLASRLLCVTIGSGGPVPLHLPVFPVILLQFLIVHLITMTSS